MKFWVLFREIAQGIRSYITFSLHLNWQYFPVPLNQKVNFKSCSVIRLMIEDIVPRARSRHGKYLAFFIYENILYLFPIGCNYISNTL